MSAQKSLKHNEKEKKRPKKENLKSTPPPLKSPGRPRSKAKIEIFQLDLVCQNIRNEKQGKCKNDKFTKDNKIHNGIKCTSCGSIMRMNWDTIQAHKKNLISQDSNDDKEYDILYGYYINKTLKKDNKEFLVVKIGKTTLTSTQFDRLGEEKLYWKKGANVDISVPSFDEIYNFAKNDTLAGLEKYDNLLFLFKADPSQERIIRCQLSAPIHEDEISSFFEDLNCLRKIGKTEYIYLEAEKIKNIQNAFFGGNLKIKDFPIICNDEIIGFSKQIIISKDNLEECL